MNIFEILTLTLGTGILSILCKLIFTFGKFSRTLEVIQADIASVKNDIATLRDDLSFIREDLRGIDCRLNRLDSAFTERGYWESRGYKASKSAPLHKDQ